MQSLTSICPFCKIEYPWDLRTALMQCCKDCFYKENEKTCQQCNRSYMKTFLTSNTADTFCKNCEEFVCHQCRKKVKRSEINQKFCGEKCKFLFENPTCKNCKLTFHVSKITSDRDYCSEKCKDDFTHRNCLCCNKRFKFDATSYFDIDKVRQRYCSNACRDICMKKRCKYCKKVFEYDPLKNNAPLYCSSRCDERDHMSIFEKITGNFMSGLVVAAYGGQRC